MRKLIVFFLIIVLSFSLVLPAFADDSLPDVLSNPSGYFISDPVTGYPIPDFEILDGYPYYIVFLNADGNLRVAFFNQDVTITYDSVGPMVTNYYVRTSDGSNIIYPFYGTQVRQDGSYIVDWKFRIVASTGVSNMSVASPMATNIPNEFDIPTKDYYFNEFCTGALCPATDPDHNNVCDDCGKMLAMSLRTTLFDYAIIHAREGNEYYGYNYFAIFYPSNEAEWDSKYLVYLSKTPFVPVANGYVGEDIKTCVVQRTANGENGATGWSSTSSVPLFELAYAEPEINFPLPPLEETVQEVTEGALMEEMITLAQAVKVILIIAASCLALWVLLEIFFKVFRTFRVK